MSQEEILDRNSLIKIHADELAKIVVEDVDVNDYDKLAYWRACKGDTILAQQRLQSTIEWRQGMNIDNLKEDPNWLKKEQAMRKVLWYDYLGCDQHGRPMLVERVGRWDVTTVLQEANNKNSKQEEKDEAIADNGEQIDENSNSSKGDNENQSQLKSQDNKTTTMTPTTDPFLTLHCMACETLLQMDRRIQDNSQNKSDEVKDTRGQIVIMDLKGMSAWHLDPRLAKAFGRLAYNDSQHYPDTLAHIWVVNAPYLFSALSKLIRPFLDPDTAGKVHVSSSVPRDLVDCVGADCLPVELGGNRIGIFPYDETSPISDHPR